MRDPTAEAIRADASAVPPIRGWERLARWIRPWPFLAGFALGFLALALAGRLMVRSDIMHGHIRFTRLGHRDGGFHPTIHHLMALVDGVEATGRIPVIVGGSSLLVGVGQPVERAWSGRLQTLLGDRFVVLNLATRGGDPNELGLWMTEYLLSRGHQAIYVYDHLPSKILNAGGRQELGMFAEARAAGILLPWGPRTDAYAAATPWRDRLGFAVRAWLNEWTGSLDFWGGITYRWCATTWTPATAGFPILMPRGELPDDQGSSSRAGGRYLEAQMPLLKRMVERFRSITTSDFSIPTVFPPQIREHSVVVVAEENPALLARLAEEDLAQRHRLTEMILQVYRQYGVPAVLVTEHMTESDFADGRHFSVSGGDRIADMVAPLVLGVASRIGQGVDGRQAP